MIQHYYCSEKLDAGLGFQGLKCEQKKAPNKIWKITKVFVQIDLNSLLKQREKFDGASKVT